LNLHVGWRSADEKYAVRIWGKNVTNQRSVVDATKFTPFFATFPEFKAGDYLAQTFWTDQRTVGITFSVRQ
jgi:hypothetical protein